MKQQSEAASGKTFFFSKIKHCSMLFCFSISAGCVDVPWGEVIVACVLGPDTNCAIHVRRNVPTEEACLKECARNNQSKDILTNPCVVFIWDEKEGKFFNIFFKI